MNQPLWNNVKTIERPQMKPWVLPQPQYASLEPENSLAFSVEGFSPISLNEMDAVALLNRVDTKFVMAEAQLFSVLRAIKKDYRILTINHHCLNHYRTLYFDTPDFELYEMHVNENAERYKVRYREYLDTFQSYLEVKHKTRKDRTIKDRIATTQPYMDLTPETEDWLEGVFPYDTQKLEAKLWNTFTRITLVNVKSCERVTLDTDLVFYSSDKFIRMNGLAIAEVKACSTHQESPFLSQMVSRRIHPNGFSKYCMGISLLYDGVKKNAMKPKILMVNKLMFGEE